MLHPYARTILVAWSEPDVERIFDERELLRRWLEVEAALALAQAELGVIPAAAAEAIAAHADVDRIDIERVLAGIRRTGHELVPLLDELAARSGDAARYLHLGATTQDILDTAAVLQLRELLSVVEGALRRVIEALADLAERHASTPMAGRTHGQHAVPTTFGFKLAVVLAELLRHDERIGELRPRLLVGQLGGAVGTMAGFGEHGRALRARVMARLGLGAPDIAWQASRDSFAEYVALAAMIGATLAKLAGDLARLQSTEIAEVAEGAGPERVGSSTMPGKQNPAGCEAVIAAATVLRECVPTALSAMQTGLERDGGTWTAELSVLPRASALLVAALRRTHEVIAGLRVDPARMLENLRQRGGLIAGEAVALDLAREIGRDAAYALVARAAARAAERGRTLAEIFEEQPFAASLTPRRARLLREPEGYTGQAAEDALAVVRRARERLAAASIA